MIRHKSPCHAENEIEIQNVKIRTALLLIKSSSDKGFFLYHKTSAPGVGKALPVPRGFGEWGRWKEMPVCGVLLCGVLTRMALI